MDSSNNNFDLGASHADVACDPVWDADESIESWAAQSLPWSQSSPASSEATEASTACEGLIGDAPNQLCYGMVRDSDLIGLSLLSVFLG